jgi:hypothetical protein
MLNLFIVANICRCDICTVQTLTKTPAMGGDLISFAILRSNAFSDALFLPGPPEGLGLGLYKSLFLSMVTHSS